MGKLTCSFPCLTHTLSGSRAFKSDTSMELPNLRVWSCLITLVKWGAQPPMSPNVSSLVPLQMPCQGRGSQGWALPLTREPCSDDLLSPKVIPQEKLSVGIRGHEDLLTPNSDWPPVNPGGVEPWEMTPCRKKAQVGPTFTQAESRGRFHGKPFEFSFFLHLPPPFPSPPLSFISPAFPSFFPLSLFIMRFMWLSSKESTCQGRRRRLDPWVGKIFWKRPWPPTPVFLPGESHGQRSLEG